MKLPVYQVDAFADKLFAGNPAAVIPLQEWLPDDLMQQIAMENNLSETVFFVPVPGEPVMHNTADPIVLKNIVSSTSTRFDIRWFTPEVEINLCGHATLAAAYVLFNFMDYSGNTLTFESKSGPLIVTKKDDLIEMDFPSWNPSQLDEIPAHLSEALGGVPIRAAYQYRDILAELPSEAAVRDCIPDFGLIKKHFQKVIITAPGDEVDFVSRFFAPGVGIDEDPVTGSAHSQLIPYWSNKLSKVEMKAHQLSKRGGVLYCKQQGERVIMSGAVHLFMKGEIYLP